jgi:putative spermidine/putrescine transport system permease protein
MSSTSRDARPGPGRSVILGLFAACAVLPIAGSLVYAAAYSVGLAGLLSHGLTLDHWRRALADREVGAAFAMSAYVASAVLILTVCFALGLALSLRRFLRRGPLAGLIYFPLALPGTVAALCAFQWLSGAGLMARVAFHLGWIASPTQFPGLVFDPWGVGIIAAQVALGVPFFTLLFGQLAAREKLTDLCALASTLGAGRAACLWRISVPLLLSKAAANLALFFVAVAGSFEIPLLLGPQNPQMISVLAWRRFSRFDLTQKPEAFIVSLLYTAGVLLFLAVWFQRRGRDRLDT